MVCGWVMHANPCCCMFGACCMHQTSWQACSSDLGLGSAVGTQLSCIVCVIIISSTPAPCCQLANPPNFWGGSHCKSTPYPGGVPLLLRPFFALLCTGASATLDPGQKTPLLPTNPAGVAVNAATLDTGLIKFSWPIYKVAGLERVAGASWGILDRVAYQRPGGPNTLGPWIFGDLEAAGLQNVCV